MTVAHRTAGQLEENESVRLKENFHVPVLHYDQEYGTPEEKKKTLIAVRQQSSRTAGSARASSPLPAKLKHPWGRPDKKRERRRQFMM